MIEAQARNAAPEGDTSLQIAPLPRVSIQAFCETPDVAEAMQAVAADRRLEKAHVKVQMGGARAAADAYRNAPTPNVIVIETDARRDELLAHLERLAEVCDAGTRVVIIGHVNDVLLYRELIRRGVSEYLVAPVPTIDLVRALSELFRAPDAEPVGRLVAFCGAKGGAGASSVAHNVSFAMAKGLGVETVVADLDLAFGTAGLDFNQDPPQGIAEAVFSPERLDANFIDRLLFKCAEKLSLLAAPATLERSYDFSEDSFDGLVDILRLNVPCAVLDLPRQWTAWTRRMMTVADEIVIVATPDLASLRNAKNLMDLLKAQRPNDAMPRLILNQVGLPKRPEIKPADFASALDVEPIAVIPFDAALFGTAANNGQMILETQSSHKINDSFLEVARIVTGKSETKNARRGLLTPILARLSAKRA
ncbi:MAG TPA: CtpF protein [Hyphomicrobiales bacterium]|nr:CtpF protein [Hyphomicrobiales bacterium]